MDKAKDKAKKANADAEKLAFLISGKSALAKVESFDFETTEVQEIDPKSHTWKVTIKLGKDQTLGIALGQVLQHKKSKIDFFYIDGLQKKGEVDLYFFPTSD